MTNVEIHTYRMIAGAGEGMLFQGPAPSCAVKQYLEEAVGRESGETESEILHNLQEVNVDGPLSLYLDCAGRAFTLGDKVAAIVKNRGEYRPHIAVCTVSKLNKMSVVLTDADGEKHTVMFKPWTGNDFIDYTDKDGHFYPGSPIFSKIILVTVDDPAQDDEVSDAIGNRLLVGKPVGAMEKLYQDNCHGYFKGIVQDIGTRYISLKIADGTILQKTKAKIVRLS